jgi:carboxypeptidase family protein
MSKFLRSLVSGLIIFLLAGTTSINAAPQGFVEGHLKIIFGMAVGPSDDMPRQSVTAETYSQYPLVVLSQEENKQIARVTADENGNYRVELPPGNYVLDIQDRVAKHVRAAPRPFTVSPGQTVRVDMNVVIGIRRLQSAGADR